MDIDPKRLDNLRQALARTQAVADAALEETADTEDARVQLARALSSVIVVAATLADALGLAQQVWDGPGLPVDPDSD